MVGQPVFGQDWAMLAHTRIWLVAAALAATACSDSPGGQTDASPADADYSGDILDVLNRLDGMSATEEPVEPPYRFFRIELEQPVDHDQPGGETFSQRMTLLYRASDAPTILHTTGYYLYEEPFRAEATRLLDGNQIHVEQRYFPPSQPEPADWDKLTIEQAAADHHRVVSLFGPLLSGSWLSTGASKGGMTSIYHRRFYPDDVAATVAYVAPISFGAPDTRYHAFFDTVGTSTCRDDLRAYEREMLIRRDAMLVRLEQLAAGSGASYQRSGGLEGAYEDAIASFSWSFWQYGEASWCGAVPPTDASDDVLWSFLLDTGGLSLSDDESIGRYAAYYYQAETELGYPSVPTAHLDDLFETEDVPRDYLPDGVTPMFDPTAMEDIDSWFKSDGDRVLLVYGEYDPWYAGAFELGQTDSLRLVAAGRNHGADLSTLDASSQQLAFEALERWMGVAPAERRARLFPDMPQLRTPLRSVVSRRR